MTGSMKNRGMHPIGTRVHIAQDKFKRKIGTVVEYTEDGEKMCVHWDGDYIHHHKCPAITEVPADCRCGWTTPRITSGFSPMELKEVGDEGHM